MAGDGWEMKSDGNWVKEKDKEGDGGDESKREWTKEAEERQESKFSSSMTAMWESVLFVGGLEQTSDCWKGGDGLWLCLTVNCTCICVWEVTHIYSQSSFTCTVYACLYRKFLFEYVY